MTINRINDNTPSTPANHFDMCGFNLQTASSFSVGMSFYLPGGHVPMNAAAAEVVYICLEGTMTVETENGSFELNEGDSLMVVPGDVKGLCNKTKKLVRMLVIIGKKN